MAGVLLEDGADAGMRSASHVKWPTGENLSWAPCHSSTGRMTAAGSKPQSLSRARSSSSQPYDEPRSASR